MSAEKTIHEPERRRPGINKITKELAKKMPDASPDRLEALAKEAWHRREQEGGEP